MCAVKKKKKSLTHKAVNILLETPQRALGNSPNSQHSKNDHEANEPQPSRKSASRKQHYLTTDYSPQAPPLSNPPPPKKKKNGGGGGRGRTQVKPSAVNSYLIKAPRLCSQHLLGTATEVVRFRARNPGRGFSASLAGRFKHCYQATATPR